MDANHLFRANSHRLIVSLLLAALLVACGGTVEGPTDDLAMPTPIISDPGSVVDVVPTVPAPAVPTAAPVDTSTISPTAVPAATNTAPAPAATLAAPAAGATYRVAFVEADDVLNVRSGPGVENSVTGTLSPQATGVQITGAGRQVSGSIWVPISAGGVIGWVNSRFLTQVVAPDTFCQDEAVQEVLQDLQTAVTNQDGALLAQLVHPERGLRIRHAWWNPEVRLSHDEVSRAFSSATSYDWGTEDGSGFAITGSFMEEILPLLQRDLLSATETACNEILNGATTGLIQLPDGYQEVNFYSLHRPSSDASGFDWGTWVVGIEQWQGTYYVGYLVHFAYEI